MKPNTANENSSITKVRVLYADTDRMGVAYHGTYFRWFEAGRADYMRRRGAAYSSIEAEGVFLPVVEANAEYLKPAIYDEVLKIATWISEVEKVQLTFIYRIFRKEELLARGFTRHAAIDGQGKIIRIPPFVREALLREEVADLGELKE